MGRNRPSFTDDTTLEFPKTGFWVLHAVGAAALFFLGMRFAARRAPWPLMVLLRLLRYR